MRHSFALVALFLALASSAFAADDRGVQFLPDETAIAVTKDVGGERWSIQLDFERATLSGTVYIAGAAPAFIWCAITGETGPDPLRDSLLASCLGSTRCPAPPCGMAGDDWSFIADIAVPGSFFLP